mmetsp:Transcript_4220/g.12682  ORF Transcript_4220/g.12682 Transcript_4220/m.12682 type:complete len:413 (-) Transcript_4220:296-1534(-)
MRDGGGGHGGKYPAMQMVLSEAVAGGVTLFVLWMTSRWLKGLIAPLMEDSQNQKNMQKAVIDRLTKAGIDPSRLVNLSQWEIAIAQELVFPEDIEGGLDTIGGMDEIKQVLFDDILIPLERPDLFSSNPLLAPPRGILLYGPPGTGKTSLAKALAKQSGIRFMCVAPSSLLSKWVGDTQQLTRAIFSLAHRIEPCVIFLDEIDALFRERSSGDHEVYRDMKAEFMQLWDGLFTNSASQIIVIGCTNRPWDVDPAIQRRLPRSIQVDLPDKAGRVAILRTILNQTRKAPKFDYESVAERAEGYSGSDLRELCRCALMKPMKEKVHSEKAAIAGRNSQLRPLTTEDMLSALAAVRPTSEESAKYRNKLLQRDDAAADHIDDFGAGASSQFLREVLIDALSKDAQPRYGTNVTLD